MVVYYSKEKLKEIKNFLDTNKIGYELRQYPNGSINIYVAWSFDYSPKKNNLG